MSVLIQGMEMPKPFDHLFVGENLAGDLFVRNDTQEGDNVVWYPLIEIPPHGRLIDADELYKAFKRLHVGFYNKEDDPRDRFFSECDLPDVQPVVHGKWIRLDMHRGMEQYKCSICNSECYVPECMGEPMYCFCPNCGAAMHLED